MSVLHPPIQEEVTIRKNIALGPTGLGQYFPVLSLPLGLGGVIRIQYGVCSHSPGGNEIEIQNTGTEEMLAKREEMPKKREEIQRLYLYKYRDD